MGRLATFFLCVVLAAVSIASPLESVTEEITLVEDIIDFIAQHPSSEVTPLAQESNLGVIRYTLGKRVAGDKRVGTASKKYKYTSPKNVKVTLTYPRTGAGKRVSFVEIIVNQSSNNGRSYVVLGGIGKRSITIAIEAKGVKSLSYAASFYGH